MRALTLTQPWAGLVASGIKLIENRPRPIIARSSLPLRFAIHASRGLDEQVYHRILEIAPELATAHDSPPQVAIERPWFKLSQINSAVIGVATVVEIIDDRFASSKRLSWIGQRKLDPDQRRWFFGPIGYVLADVVALERPVPRPGALGFWTLDEDTRRAVEEQL